VRYRAVALAALLLGIGVSPVAARAALPLSPVKVMVLGDSLSHGFGGDWTWRYWLWREFARQSVGVDFVGPSTSVSSGRYERELAWDRNHASRGGATVDTFLTGITGLLDTYDPDVLVVELGFNDVRRGDTPDQVSVQLLHLLENALAGRPDLKLVVGELTASGVPAEDAATAEVNAALTAWADRHGAEVAQHRAADEGGPAWDLAKHTFDDLHPNEDGQTLLAHRFADALNRVGVLPRAVEGIYRTRSWAPDARPDVSAVPDGTRVRWSTALSEIKADAVRVLVDGEERTDWLPRDQAKVGVLLDLEPGEHEVQLVVRRGRMRSTPGSAVVVTVPGTTG